jgi:ADP-heptose:LPS heptosyltransferase
MKYSLGAIKNPKDLRDIKLTQVQQPVSIPLSYQTDISFLPVLNQKGLGACVGHAHALIHIYNEYKENKVLKNLPHTVERYLKVFEHAGFPAVTRRGPWINVDADSKIYAQDFFKRMGLKKKETLWVGFAPFAGHELKEWPMYKSILLVKLIQTEFNACIFLFGSTEERKKLKVIQGDLENCFLVSGEKMGIRGELGIMEKLDLMIGMDSSNIHLMALLKKPVIGIFGTTHPYSGFGPYGQEDSGVLQIENLPCRPCSIYGNTTCYRKDFACMEMIDPADVIKRIRFILNVNTLW